MVSGFSLSANLFTAILTGIVFIICLLKDLLAVNKTVKLEKRTLEIEDRGIKLRLTVVDTPGFGDLIDSTDW